MANKMLDDVMNTFLDKFKAAADTKRYTETLKVIEEMKSHFKAHPPEQSEVVCYLNAVAAGSSPPGGSLVFTAIWCNPSNAYQQPLCHILESELAKRLHEPAVELLAQIGDVEAIPTLRKAIGYRWDYDDWLSIPRKALQALRCIGTPEAMAIIQEASASSEKLIREEAKSLLDSNV